jgi:hypothetical protein
MKSWATLLVERAPSDKTPIAMVSWGGRRLAIAMALPGSIRCLCFPDRAPSRDLERCSGVHSPRPARPRLGQSSPAGGDLRVWQSRAARCKVGTLTNVGSVGTRQYIWGRQFATTSTARARSFDVNTPGAIVRVSVVRSCVNPPGPALRSTPS